MRKPILAIIAIFCLQAAFITYMNRPPAELALAPEFPAAVDEVVGDLVDLRFMTESSIPELPEPAAVVASEVGQPRSDPSSITVARQGHKKAGRYRTASKDPVPKGSRRGNDDAFNDVVITYVRSAETTDCEGDAEKSQKSSLLAKAAPIVKKPWGFLKSIGSKFN